MGHFNIVSGELTFEKNINDILLLAVPNRVPLNTQLVLKTITHYSFNLEM